MTLSYNPPPIIVQIVLTPRYETGLVIASWEQEYELLPVLEVEFVQPYSQLVKAQTEWTQPYSKVPIGAEFVQPYLTQGVIYLAIDQDYVLVRNTRDEFYASFLARRNLNAIDFDYYDIKVMLLDSTYPVEDGLLIHQYRSDLTQYEVSGTGYTPSGESITTGNTGLYWLAWLEGQYEGAAISDKQHTLLTANAPIKWVDAVFTTRYAALYAERPSGERSLISLLDFGYDVVVDGTFHLPLRDDNVVFDVNPDFLAFYNHELWRSMVGANACLTAGNTTSLDMSLISDVYVFDAAHDRTDVTAHSIKFMQLVGCSTSIEGADSVIRLPDNRALFAEVTGTFRYIFCRTALSPEGCLLDIGTTTTLSGGDFVLQAPNGIIAAKTRVQ